MSLAYVGRAGLLHIGVFTLLLPWLAWRSARRQRHRPWPPRKAVFRSVLVQQAVFLAFSVYAARHEWVPLYLAPDAWWIALGLAAVVTATLGLLMRPIWRDAVQRNEPRMQLARLETPTEYALWVVVSLAAGIAEEVSYRGVLWVLLERVTGSSLVAAVLAAIAFGLGHSLQGKRSMVIITLVALGMHALVRVTGSLLAPILVHVSYDVIAGFTYACLHRKQHPGGEAAHA